ALSLALATLTRSILFLFPFLLVGLDLVFNLRIFGERFEFRKLKKMIVFIIIFLLPISCWTYRNYKVFNSFVPLATEAGHAFYFSYHPKDGKIFGVANPDETSKEILKNPSEVEQNKLFMQAAIESIKKDPIQALKYIGLKNMYFWSIFDWEILGLEGIYNFSTAFIIPFFFFGACWLLFLKDKRPFIFLLLPIIYIYVMSIIFMGLPRNRYTIEQFMIIIASFCMMRLFEIFKQKGIYVSSVLCWLGFNVYLFINFSATKEWFKLFFERINLW
ncbi:MAG: hypothetical protein KAU58_03150, partial [Candidatus Omnitrophica bacterium]|nr:hypothetical protein [Candidatus Omnitrophota bacterium]